MKSTFTNSTESLGPLNSERYAVVSTFDFVDAKNSSKSFAISGLI